MKPKYSRIPAFLLAAVLFLSGCSSSEFYTIEEMMEMDSKDFRTGGKIKMKDLEKYRIIYPDSADEMELELVHKFRDTVAAKTGVTLEVVSDMAGYTEEGLEIGKYEIVLGGCYRPEIDALVENYCAGTEGWNVIENRLYIYKSSYDYSDNGLDSVVESFISEVLDSLSPDDPVFFDSETDAYVKKNSMTEQLILNGRPITEYELVTLSQETWDDPDDDLRGLAKNLRWRLSEVCGDILPVVTLDEMDETADKGRIFVGGDQMTQEILEGKFRELFEESAPEDDFEDTSWSVESDGDYVRLDGTSSYAVMEAIDAFLELVTPPEEEGRAVQDVLLPAEPVTGEVPSEIELLCTDFGGEMHDSWAMERYISTSHPDLLITTGLHSWLSLDGGLENDFQPYYTCFGKWGDTFLYCTDRFEVQGEMYDTYVLLRDRVTEEVFLVADMTRTETGELPEYPMIRVDFRKDEPVEGEEVTILSCEDAAMEVGGYLGQENMRACLYRMTVEE